MLAFRLPCWTGLRPLWAACRQPHLVQRTAAVEPKHPMLRAERMSVFRRSRLPCQSVGLSRIQGGASVRKLVNDGRVCGKDCKGDRVPGGH